MFQLAWDLDPTRERHLLALCRALAATERWTESAFLLARGRRQFPLSAAVLLARALMLACGPEGVGDPARAEDLAGEAYQTEATLSAAEVLSLALAASGKFHQATRILESALKRAGAYGVNPLWRRLDALRLRCLRQEPPVHPWSARFPQDAAPTLEIEEERESEGGAYEEGFEGGQG